MSDNRYNICVIDMRANICLTTGTIYVGCTFMNEFESRPYFDIFFQLIKGPIRVAI